MILDGAALFVAVVRPVESMVNLTMGFWRYLRHVSTVAAFDPYAAQTRS